MNSVVVGVADCRLSNDQDSSIITYALGSCMAVAIHDRVAGVGGLLHFMLPESQPGGAGNQRNPYMFADTGVPLLFRRAYELGAEKRRISVCLAGGSQMMDENGVFNIGKRNYLAIRKILWKAGVLVQGEEIGGTGSRTVRLEVGTGRFLLRGPGEPEREMQVSHAARKGL
jgi:chemotaxis protein CheD